MSANHPHPRTLVLFPLRSATILPHLDNLSLIYPSSQEDREEDREEDAERNLRGYLAEKWKRIKVCRH